MIASGRNKEEAVPTYQQVPWYDPDRDPELTLHYKSPEATGFDIAAKKALDDVTRGIRQQWWDDREPST